MRLLQMEGLLMDPNPYDVLGIPVNASQWQIREAFKLMMRGVRKRMVSDPQAYETYQDIRSAYELLSNYVARCRYNTEHGLSEPPPPRTGRTTAGTWSWGDVVDALHLFLVLLVSFAIFAFGVYAKLSFLDWLY